MKNALLATLLFVGTVGLTACGTLTGIPSHGGGKRFAVEQELVAASARAAAKEMDLSALQGRKVARSLCIFLQWAIKVLATYQEVGIPLML